MGDPGHVPELDDECGNGICAAGYGFQGQEVGKGKRPEWDEEIKCGRGTN